MLNMDPPASTGQRSRGGRRSGGGNDDGPGGGGGRRIGGIADFRYKKLNKQKEKNK